MNSILYYGNRNHLNAKNPVDLIQLDLVLFWIL